ncbi:MAG TPA: serine/threonine-protein kinase [Pyrinomonadaceae bacterium]
MDSERWKKVEEVFEAAADRPEGERAAYLDAACSGDAGLRREVEELLAHRQPTGALISTLFLDGAKLLRREARVGAEDDDARFLPGDVLAERYRVVGALGRGGMGEVWRADDLKLKQAVALKFLPEKLSKDAEMLGRFHREVRTARRVSHPNVCRVFDIGETGGSHFLSMEYIDGEDLSSLLRRIGRLPEDKAVEVARQICAGLAAAHDEGVLHRDLKPANVMIDGRGRARITDFGLAGLADEITGRDISSGTPAYMAPEQLTGKEVSARSDIYSLGLLLYEVFTGRKAFDAPSLDELIRQRETSAPPSISSFIKDVDPVVERVIQRCLESDPSKRPASALQVAAALPGGDPLAAALAAGETPSPEMVAATPREGVLRPAVAVALLASVLVMFAATVMLADRIELYRFVPLEKSPDVLRERAREVAGRFGYASPAADEADGFGLDPKALDYIEANDPSPDRWEKLKTGRPPAIGFWHRGSPRQLVPSSLGAVWWDDPAPIIAGMTTVYLDTRGRLLHFYGVPPQVEEPRGEAEEARGADWAAMLREAGLEPSALKAVESQWAPLYLSDARAAWEGVYPENPAIPIRVEAAAYRGRPVYFEIVHPWDTPARQEEERPTAGRQTLGILIFGLLALGMVGSALLARRNLRLGRGDRKGAARIAACGFAVGMLLNLSRSHHTPTPDEFFVIINCLAWSIFTALFWWLLYLSVEPFVRRRWPHRIISWTRLVGGDWRDPLVGRDVLVGALAGLTVLVFSTLLARTDWLGGGGPFRPVWQDSSSWLGLSYFGVAFAHQFRTPLVVSLFFIFIMLVLSFPFRRGRAGAFAVWLIITVVWGLIGGATLNAWVGATLAAAILTFVVHRYGLLAMFAAQVFIHHLIFFPTTSDLTAWWAAGFALDLFILLAVIALAFRQSLGGQPLLGRAFPDD